MKTATHSLYQAHLVKSWKSVERVTRIYISVYIL